MSVRSNKSLRAVRFAAIFAAAMLVVLAAAIWVFGTPAPVQQLAAIGGPFSLIDGGGRQLTDKAFRGRYMLVYFGYTFCPDVCPTTLNDIAQALNRLGSKADRVEPVFITIDPARDTPDIVRSYVEAFSPRFTGLTGTPEQIAAVAREYRVYYAKHKTGTDPQDYSMDHSSILYLMSPIGEFVAIISAEAGPTQIAVQLEHYLR